MATHPEYADNSIKGRTEIGVEGTVMSNKAVLHPQRPVFKIDRRVGFAIIWIVLTIILAATIYLAAFGASTARFLIF